jgi:dynein heavy chain
VNCCTIDWFREWPAEALYAVAKQQMTITDLQLPNLEGTVNMFKVIHQSVEEKVIEFRDVFRRISYVTPTSYLELLSMYKKILHEKRTENSFARNRLIKGLEVLKDAAIEVDRMQKQLEED